MTKGGVELPPTPGNGMDYEHHRSNVSIPWNWKTAPKSYLQGRKKLVQGKSKTKTKTKKKEKGSSGAVRIGKLGPRFPKTRKAKPNKFSRYGVQLQYEYRNTQSDANCVYVGYGVPAQRAIEAAWYCIVKRLFINAGFEIENFDQTIPVPSSAATKSWTVYINYWKSISSTALSTTTYTHDYSAGKVTYSDMVIQICKKLDTDITDASTPVVWQKVELFEGIVATPSGNHFAYLSLDTAQISLKYKGILNIQNTTTAPGGDAQTKYQTDRIDVNPLRGRKYTVNGTNAILPRIRDEATVAAYKAMLVDCQTGYFTFNAVNEAGPFTTLSTLMGSGFYKTPDPSSFVKAKYAGVNLEPGEIKKDKQFFKWKGSFQRLMEILYDQLQDYTAGGSYYVKFGRVTMFAFEHALCQTTENPISIDFEGDFEVAASMSFKKVRSVPVVRVQ